MPTSKKTLGFYKKQSIFWKSIIITFSSGMIISIGIILISFLLPTCYEKEAILGLPKFDISGTSITFGITYSAFSITALTLLTFLHGKIWFSTFKQKFNLIDRMINNYKLSIKLNMIFTLWSIIASVFMSQISEIVSQLVNYFNILVIIFLSVYIYKNVVICIELIKIEDK